LVKPTLAKKQDAFRERNIAGQQKNNIVGRGGEGGFLTDEKETISLFHSNECNIFLLTFWTEKK
jgi:hypothetical protein